MPGTGEGGGEHWDGGGTMVSVDRIWYEIPYWSVGYVRCALRPLAVAAAAHAIGTEIERAVRSFLIPPASVRVSVTDV